MKRSRTPSGKRRLRLGDLSVFPLRDAGIRLDGGAMFGVVPRVLWERTNPPDSRNRVELGTNPVLVHVRGLNVLVDTGMGTRWGPREREIYAIGHEGRLMDELRGLGLGAGDIDLVVNTHLHFDHAGGNTVEAEGGALRPAFPRARYVVQRAELRCARMPNERTRASYRASDFEPLVEAGVLDPLGDDGEAGPSSPPYIGPPTELAPGVFVFRTGGHNRGIQLLRLEGGGRTALLLSDIIPTTTHLQYPYIASYDLYPLETLEVKRALLERAASEGWYLFFYHDPRVRCATVSMEDGEPRFERVL